MAAADLPFGGGKAVLAVPSRPEGAERRRLLPRYGELAASLGANIHRICLLHLRREMVDHHHRTVRAESSGDPLTDSGCGAGDDRDFVRARRQARAGRPTTQTSSPG
jgi:hypothetical protein